MGVSIADYARHRKVSYQAVYQALVSGRIHKETDGTIDSKRADAEWERNTNPAQRRTRRRNGADQDDLAVTASYNKAKAYREACAAKLLKLELEEKEGKLLSADEVKKTWFNTLRLVRDRMLGLPDRLSHVFASETDPARINEIMKTEFKKALVGLSDEIRGQE